ncbi:MAG: hypothetical protein CMP48_12795 [Rickettsiales bacterium]|nr:hypothetical protein [Rickettsiales bacterium]
MLKNFLSGLFLLCLLHLTAQDSLRTYYAWSLDAYKQKDYQLFLKYAKRANDLRPNHPTLAYNIAAAYAINGYPEKSIEALQRYLQMNASMEYMQDLDFVSLKDLPAFKALKNQVKKSQERIETSSSEFKLEQTKNHFESIGYNKKDECFLLGSITTRSLFSYSKGELHEMLSYEKNPMLYGVMGIDYSNDLIWVCSAALPEIDDYTEEIKNKSSVFGIHPGNGKVKFQYDVPNAILGDVIYVNDKLVLATDGYGNKIYQLSRSGAEVYADLSDELFNLQGLVYLDERIILSDYILGLHEYDPVTQQLSKIDSKGLYADKGSDGLLYENGYLYCFQNGTIPKRTFRLKLDDLEVQSVEIIDQNLYEKGEPTQGVFVNGEIYYISNSAWGAYDESGYTGGDDLVVRKIKP